MIIIEIINLQLTLTLTVRAIFVIEYLKFVESQDENAQASTSWGLHNFLRIYKVVGFLLNLE